MKKLLVLCIAIMSFGIYAAEPAQPSFNRASFQANADRYGNKTANLMELENITAFLGKGFRVPAFLPVSTQAIQAFLQAQGVWDQLMKLWGDFKIAQGKAPTLTDGARAALNGIEQLLQNAFTQNQFMPKMLSKLGLIKNRSLMVRSTGKEDTDVLANAGGNKSIANAAPDKVAISKAIGEVLASYFSEKSISQRIVANDENLFADPFVPVLIQVMIGSGTLVSVSGVMFSQEAEGQTPGVTQIQATWGHGEGVVNGLVPVDTYYVGNSEIIHPLIRVKSERIAPVEGKAELSRVTNAIEYQTKSCLTPQQVVNLKRASDVIHNYYGKPMDIEFVVQGNTIYLVQARPIVHKITNPPSYLSDTFVTTLAPEVRQQGITIGAAGGSVRVISNANQAIVYDNIRAALDQFLYHTPNQDAIKAIIVGELAPATSHEATTFRGAGKPVIYVNDVSTIKQWLEQKNPVLVDVQRALLVAQTPAKGATVAGWYAHPIPKKVSVMPAFIADTQLVQGLDTKEYFKSEKLRALLTRIKVGTKQEVQQALGSVLHRAYLLAKKAQDVQKKEPGIEGSIIQDMGATYQALVQAAGEVLKTADSANRLERLYPITFFEALMLQVFNPREFVNDYSIATLRKVVKEEEKIGGELPGDMPANMKQYAVQYAKIAQYALVDSLAKDWKVYIAARMQSGNTQDNQRFARMMVVLQQLGVTPLWLNLSFARAYKEQGGNTVQVTQALLKEYESVQDFLKLLQTYAQRVTALDIAAWEDPGKFKSQMKELESLVAYFTSDSFLGVFNQPNLLAQNAAIAGLKAFVDRFDQSIKSLEASGSYKGKDALRVKNFQVMLDQYFTLLVSLPMVLKGDFGEYSKLIRDIIDKAPIEISQLKPSPRFNVSGATFGTAASWGRSVELYGNKPTLEDMFTLIHQNLLVIIAGLTQKAGLENVATPNVLHTIVTAAKGVSISKGTNQARLLGIDFNGDDLTYFFNLALREHSCIFNIVYHLIDGQMSMAVQFVGAPGMDAKESRWHMFAKAIPVISALFTISLIKNPVVDSIRGLLTITYKLDATNYKDTFEGLELMAEATLFSDINVIKYVKSPDKLLVDVTRIIEKNPFLAIFLWELAKKSNKKEAFLDMVSAIIQTVSPEHIPGMLAVLQSGGRGFPDNIALLLDKTMSVNSKKLVEQFTLLKDIQLNDAFYNLMKRIWKDNIQFMRYWAKYIFPKIYDIKMKEYDFITDLILSSGSMQLIPVERQDTFKISQKDKIRIDDLISDEDLVNQDGSRIAGPCSRLLMSILGAWGSLDETDKDDIMRKLNIIRGGGLWQLSFNPYVHEIQQRFQEKYGRPLAY